MKTIVLAVFSLQGNGAERVVQTLARTMNAMGHQAHIVVFKDDIDHDLDPEVPIHRFPYRLWRSLPRKIRGKVAAMAFYRFVKKHISDFSIVELKQLEDLLNFDDDILFKWYLNKKVEIKIPNNKVSNLLKNFKI